MESEGFPVGDGDLCVIERMSNYGSRMGDTILDTIFWSGRFAQVLLVKGASVRRMKRASIKSILTGSVTTKDKHIRAALIARFGGDPSSKKRNDIPEVLKGIEGDGWASLAVAIAAGENLAMQDGNRLAGL